MEKNTANGAHDLGHGWFASFGENGEGTMTVRNPDKGQRINLSVESVDRLRAIFNKVRDAA